MNESERNPKVALEDLLQLKRAERPPVDFWPRFEQELRAKQLAALVQPVRPWWHSLVSRRLLVRAYAPLGAAAVVALSLSLVQRPSASPVALAKASPMAIPVAETAAPVAVRIENQLAEQVVVTADSAVVAEHEARHEAAAEPVAIASSSTGTSPEQLLLAGTATVRAAGQALAQMVGLMKDSSAEEDSTQNNAVEPLTQLSTPRDNRRSRLLAYTVAYDPHAAGSQDAARSRERITRRISDESIYDSISRLGVSGDRVSIKF